MRTTFTGIVFNFLFFLLFNNLLIKLSEICLWLYLQFIFIKFCEMCNIVEIFTLLSNGRHLKTTQVSSLQCEENNAEWFCFNMQPLLPLIWITVVKKNTHQKSTLCGYCLTSKFSIFYFLPAKQTAPICMIYLCTFLSLWSCYLYLFSFILWYSQDSYFTKLCAE